MTQMLSDLIYDPMMSIDKLLWNKLHEQIALRQDCKPVCKHFVLWTLRTFDVGTARGHVIFLITHLDKPNNLTKGHENFFRDKMSCAVANMFFDSYMTKWQMSNNGVTISNFMILSSKINCDVRLTKSNFWKLVQTLRFELCLVLQIGENVSAIAAWAQIMIRVAASGSK